MQLGYTAPFNEDCEVRDNVIVNGGLQIKGFKSVNQANNLVLGRGSPRPQEPARVFVQPSRYDADRAHVAIYNWSGNATVELAASLLEPFGKGGDTIRLLDPRDFYGKPVAVVRLDGKPVAVPVQGEFAALVLMKTPRP